jgi:hypothetical protein
VLALPWYGYVYPCADDIVGGACGQPCNQSGGVEHTWNCTPGYNRDQGPMKPYEIGYQDIQPLLRTSPTGVMYDHATASAWFDFQCDMNTPKVGSTPCHPGRNQIWYDTPGTLELKYSMLKAAGLRGVGMWDAGSVGYTEADGQAALMWDALSVFKGLPLNMSAKTAAP